VPSHVLGKILSAISIEIKWLSVFHYDINKKTLSREETEKRDVEMTAPVMVSPTQGMLHSLLITEKARFSADRSRSIRLPEKGGTFFKHFLVIYLPLCMKKFFICASSLISVFK
jgi:hypothetical protein